MYHESGVPPDSLSQPVSSTIPDILLSRMSRNVLAPPPSLLHESEVPPQHYEPGQISINSSSWAHTKWGLSQGLYSRQVAIASLHAEDSRIVSSTSTMYTETTLVTPQCPILAALPERLVPLSGPVCSTSLMEFLEWAIVETSLSIDRLLSLGRLLSVHLYRSHHLPLQHEYLLVCFGGDNIAESWMRLERGARIRMNVGGTIELKEDISFATSRSLLCSDSSELAYLFIPSSAAASRFLLGSWSKRVRKISQTHPQYQLLSTNCRWFSRSLLLDVVDWVNDSAANYAASWRGIPAPLSLVKSEAVKERFGGAQALPTEDHLVQAKQSYSLAELHQKHGQAKEALESCEHSLECLKLASTSLDSQVLSSHAFIICGVLLRNLGHLHCALETATHAVASAQALPDSYRDRIPAILGAFLAQSNILRKSGRPAEATRITNGAIILAERQSRSRRNHKFLPLLLTELCASLQAQGRLRDAVTAGERAARRARMAFSSSPERLSQVLCRYSSALDSMGDLDTALIVLQEAVEILNESYLMGRTSEFNYGGQLHGLSVLLLKGGQIERALDYSRQALVLFTSIYGKSDSVEIVRKLLSVALHLADLLLLSNRSSDVGALHDQILVLVARLLGFVEIFDAAMKSRIIDDYAARLGAIRRQESSSDVTNEYKPPSTPMPAPHSCRAQLFLSLTSFAKGTEPTVAACHAHITAIHFFEPQEFDPHALHSWRIQLDHLILRIANNSSMEGSETLNVITGALMEYLAHHSESCDVQRALVNTFALSARFATHFGHHSQACEAQQECVAMLQAMYSVNSTLIHELADRLGALGMCFVRSKSHTSALQCLEEGILLRRKASDNDADDPIGSDSRLCEALSQYVRVLQTTGQNGAACIRQSEVVELTRLLYTHGGTRSSLDIANELVFYASLFLLEGQYHDARKAAEEATDRCRTALNHPSPSNVASSILRDALRVHARVLFALSLHHEASLSQSEAVDLVRAARDCSPSNADHDLRLAQYLDELRNYLERSGSDVDSILAIALESSILRYSIRSEAPSV